MSDVVILHNPRCSKSRETLALLEARGIEPRPERIGELLERSLMLVTALAPHIGYDRAAAIARYAHREGTTLRDAAVALGAVSEEEFDRWVDPASMVKPAG